MNNKSLCDKCVFKLLIGGESPKNPICAKHDVELMGGAVMMCDQASVKQEDLKEFLKKEGIEWL